MVEKDMRDEGIKVVKLVMRINEERSKMTLAHAIEVLRGRKCSSKWIDPEMVSDFSGSLKIPESDIRRLILKMLLASVPDE